MPKQTLTVDNFADMLIIALHHELAAIAEGERAEGDLCWSEKGRKAFAEYDIEVFPKNRSELTVKLAGGEFTITVKKSS